MELKPLARQRAPRGTGPGFWQGVARLVLEMLEARANRYGHRPPRRPL